MEDVGRVTKAQIVGFSLGDLRLLLSLEDQYARASKPHSVRALEGNRQLPHLPLGQLLAIAYDENEERVKDEGREHSSERGLLWDDD